MFIVTITKRQIIRKLGFLAAFLVLALLTMSGGRSALFTTAEVGADRPLTRAASPDDRLALTFDVTWGDKELAKILNILDRHGVKATFFVGGTFLNEHGDLVKQIAARGHEVGTLGQLIVNLSERSEQEVITNLRASQSQLSKILGGPVRYFRPPQGPATRELVRAARQADLITVTFSLDSEDHMRLRASQIVRRVVRGARKGDIILLSASDWSPETTKALPEILRGLQDRGFRMVTISDLVPQEDGP